MGKKLSKEEFIERAKLVHNNFYNYSKIEYINNKTKVCIICPKHGEFWQVADNHLKKHGCPNCSGNKKSNREEFIEKAKLVHDGKYDYSKVEYINTEIKVCIICPIHGEFWQKPYKHLQKQGCAKCQGRKNTEEFIEQAIKIYGNRYNYSKTLYRNTETKVCIICPIHGEFYKLPNKHIKSEQGCPLCVIKSKGENKIRNFLIENNIEFEYQKTFDDCVNIRKLPFDFYLPDHNLLIEYDGKQHFNDKCKYYSKHLIINDNIKNEFAKKNKIKLLRIPYWKYKAIEKLLHINLIF